MLNFPLLSVKDDTCFFLPTHAGETFARRRMRCHYLMMTSQTPARMKSGISRGRAEQGSPSFRFGELENGALPKASAEQQIYRQFAVAPKSHA